MENSQTNDLFNKKIEPITLIYDVVRNWWCILLGALSVVMLAYVYLNMRYVPQYTTSATFVVSERDSVASYSGLSSAYEMAQTFQLIIESNSMQQTICDALGVDEIDAQISANTVGSTNLMEVTVTAASPKDSFDIMQTLLDNYESVSFYSIGDVMLNILSEPSVPFSPDNPLYVRPTLEKVFILAVAVLILFFAWISIMSDTLKQESDIEEKLDAKSMGAIAYERKKKSLRDIFSRKKQGLLVSDPLAGFDFVESYKKLSSKVQYNRQGNGKTVIAVTSLTENEGKSTVAANLAVSLAQQGNKVLLMDGDLRRPSQFLIFGIQPQEKSEIGEYLKGTIHSGRPLFRSEVENLRLFCGRNCYSNSTDILQKANIQGLLQSVEMDYIIIDTPPVSVLGDAEIWAQYADGTLFVARQNRVKAEAINTMLDHFREQNLNVLGVVLNSVVSVDSITGKTIGRYGSRYRYYKNYSRKQGNSKDE